MNFFDRRLEKEKEDVANFTPADVPVILMWTTSIFIGERRNIYVFSNRLALICGTLQHKLF